MCLGSSFFPIGAQQRLTDLTIKGELGDSKERACGKVDTD
jgi:hypothetical protein